MMNKEKKSMLFDYEWAPILKALDPHKAISFVLALVALDKTGAEPDLNFDNALEEAVFRGMVDTVIKNKEAYQERCEVNRQNGKLGGRPKTERFLEKPNGFKENRTKAKKADNDSDSDIDKDIEGDGGYINNIQGNPPAPPIEPLQTAYQTDLDEIISTWNAQSCTRKIDKIPFGTRRYSNTMICINNDLPGFLLTIRELDKQAWFAERSKRKDPLSYDWFCDPNNYLKVSEGNYKEARQETRRETEQERSMRILQEATE